MIHPRWLSEISFLLYFLTAKLASLHLARQIAWADFHEPFLRLEAITASHIPTVRGAFFLQVLDGDIDDATCEVEGRIIFNPWTSHTAIAERLPLSSGIG